MKKHKSNQKVPITFKVPPMQKNRLEREAIRSGFKTLSSYLCALTDKAFRTMTIKPETKR